MKTSFLIFLCILPIWIRVKSKKVKNWANISGGSTSTCCEKPLRR